MNKSNSLSTEEMPKANVGFENSTFRMAVISLVATIITVPFWFFLGWKSSSWQLYVIGGLVAIVVAVQIPAFPMMRRGRYENAGWLLIAGQLGSMVAGVFLIKGIGLTLGIIAIITTYLVASQSLSAKSVRRAVIVSVGLGLLLAATDLLSLDYRLSVPALQIYVPVLTVLVAVTAGSFLAWQAWQRSMRNKLLVAFIGVTVVTAGSLAVYLFTSTTRVLQQSLELRLTEHTSEAANGIGALIDEQIDLVNTLALNETLQQTIQEVNQSYQGDASAIKATMEQRDVQWRAADAANNNSDPLVHEYLTNPAALALKEFQNEFPDHAEVFITDMYGGQAGTTDRTSDYYQADEAWWQAAYNNGQGAVYVSPPEYDQSAGVLAVLIAVPLRNHQTGKIIGVLRTTFLASGFNDILDKVIGNTGTTSLLIPGETASFFHGEQFKPVEPELLKQLQAVTDQTMIQMDFGGVPSVVLQSPVQSLEEDSMVNSLGWKVVYHQAQAEALAAVNIQLRGALFVMGIVMLLAIAAAVLLSVVLIRPISELTQTAEAVATGNLNSRAKVSSTDEVGILASTFNSMTSQLQETLQGLEERVAARTRDLAIVAEVGTATATILESKRLLQEVVELTKQRFGLYHSHIYLLDEKGKNLVLTAGAGEPGRVMVAEGRSIPLDRERSLVARAARDRQGVIVNDVTQAPDFLPNPLLPDTRSELAVPMIVGDKVIGVFDIQSEYVGRFTDSDANIQTTLAAQVAVSIQNVRSFEQAKTQAELESLANAIGQKIQRSSTVEDTLQIAVRELGTAIGARRVKVNIEAGRKSETEIVK